jgi:hypothetical protein
MGVRGDLQAVASIDPSQRDAGDPETTRKAALLLRAKTRFRKANDADQNDRKEALIDLRFYVGQQWDDGVLNERRVANRPAETFNRIQPICRMVANEFRQQRPAVNVNPVGSGADINVAEIMEGIVRHIETQSDAETAYDFADEMMVVCGRGSFRFVTEWINDLDESGHPVWQQEIKVQKILNPFAVYWDPAAVQPDKSDAIYCFLTEDIDRDEFKEQYPNASLTSLSNFRGTGDELLWYPEGNRIRLAEYFEIVVTARMACLMADKSVRWEDELGGETPTEKRPVETRTVKWAKLSGAEVLEEQDIPGEWITVVTMQGHEYIVQDKRMSMGLARTMRGPQRMYNIARNGAIECVLLAPRSPWIVWEGQTENHEQEWKQSNIRNMATLTIRPVVGPDGTLLPPPQRNTWEAPIQSMTALMGQADNDLKATSGIYDASLGNKDSQDRSGKAIQALQTQGATATYSYSDNAARGIRQAGRILCGMIPHIYDTARVQRIVKPDGDAEMIPINQHFQLVQGQDGKLENKLLDQAIPGMSKFHDMKLGKYDVTVSMGPSFQTKRQEAFTLLVDLAKAFPQIMQVAGDIITANWDAPFAQELSKRLKFLLPQAIQQAEQQTAGQQAIDPAAFAQQQQTIQQLQAQLQQLVQVLREKKIENDAKSRMKLMEVIGGIIEAEVKAGTASAQSLASMNMDAIGNIVDAIQQQQAADSADAQAAQEQQQAQMLQQQQQSHQAAMASQQQAHERQMAAMPPPAPAGGSPANAPVLPGG